jgi:hypothetical protein
MSLPNIVVEGNFGVKRLLSGIFAKFIPFALKYYDAGLNAYFELKQDLSFTWYQKRNMTAKLLKQKSIDTGLIDQYITVEDLGFEQERSAILSHGWQNVISDADYPAQASANVDTDWTEIPTGDYYTIQAYYMDTSGKVFLLIVNFNATNSNVKLKLYPTEKEFTLVLEQGKALGFYSSVPGPAYGGDVIQFCQILVLSPGFKYKIIYTDQNPNTKIFNVKFQEFKDANIPPSNPASQETSGFEGAIYLFNLTAP